MSGSKVQIIAEVKTGSPFGGEFKDWDKLFEIANQVGDMISVHTNPDWDGSFERIAEARSKTLKPILAKGLHEYDDEIEWALANGANKVLVVGRVPSFALDKCLLEPYSLAEMQTYPEEAQVVWNSRDLNTGDKKLETFEQARSLWPGWLCQASFIRTVDDIKPGADAVLVGTHLEEFAKSLRSEVL